MLQLYKMKGLLSTAVQLAVVCAPVTQRARVRSPAGQVSWVRFFGVFSHRKTNVRKLTVTEIKVSRLRWIGHVQRMDKNEIVKRIMENNQKEEER